MKLSEVRRAHELVGDRRNLLKAYVDVGVEKDIDAQNYGAMAGRRRLFGYAVDEPLVEAVRKAVRLEIRRRIDQVDALLGKLGVEVDGVEIAIRSEEQARNEGEPEEKAA